MTPGITRHRLWEWGQWLVIPLVVFTLAEGIVRATFDSVPRWYAAAQRVIAQGRVDAVFIGSSRIAAAVHVPSFEKEIFALTGWCPRALNLGQGYSTYAEHFLGLRNLFASHLASLQGVTVFVEAAGGMPSLSRWDESWVSPQQPWMVVDLLQWKDLLPFWHSSGLSISGKLHLTLRFLIRNISSTFNRRERVREQLLERGTDWLLSLRHGRIPPNPFREATVHFELAGPDTNIRTDPARLRHARELAVLVSDQALIDQKPLRGWDTAIEKDLIELVRSHEGQVVFFDVPLSSLWMRPNATSLRQEDIRIFRDQARAWGTPVLRPQVSFDDDDLPDLWHVDPSLALTFSIELARAWVATLRATGHLPAGAEVTCSR